ncbi:MAG: DUF4333 domain-containing protein [Solirubrobacteraceae bacterium]
MLDYKRKLLVPVGAIGAAITFAGCTTQIDAGKAANLVKKVFASAPPKSISCPSGIDAKAGGHFDCRVTEPNGSKYIVTIHMKDSSGHVEIGPGDVRPVSSAAGSSGSGSSSATSSSTTKSAY